jgi:uncharacterized protein (TIGR02145 family)
VSYGGSYIAFTYPSTSCYENIFFIFNKITACKTLYARNLSHKNMKHTTLVFCIILCHLKVFSQNIEVKGGIIADSIDVSSGLIRNVANPINAQDASTKSYVDTLLAQFLVTMNNTLLNQGLNGTLSDIEGNIYKTIKIGDQVWMAENLKTTKYNDGTVIPLITDGTLWGTASTNGAAAYCWYNAPNESTNLTTYGALYNWYAVDTLSNGNKNVCPTGWHVPTDGEWTTLTTYLGGEGVAGGKMKEAGLAHWKSPNEGATNESGFAGRPGGFHSNRGTFSNVGYYGSWWSSSEFNTTDAWSRDLVYDDDLVLRGSFNKGSGFSVRCLRD